MSELWGDRESCPFAGLCFVQEREARRAIWNACLDIIDVEAPGATFTGYVVDGVLWVDAPDKLKVPGRVAAPEELHHILRGPLRCRLYHSEALQSRFQAGAVHLVLVCDVERGFDVIELSDAPAWLSDKYERPSSS